MTLMISKPTWARVILATALVSGCASGAHRSAASTTTAARVTPSTSTAVATPCPVNLAAGLARTGDATQLITAVASGWDNSVATVEIWTRNRACWEPAGGPWSGLIGQNGFSNDHREGDGTTPTGMYTIGPTLYGNAPNPGGQEPYFQLVCGDWWDEDPTSQEYNTFQQLPCGTVPPFGGDSEPLWQETAPYPSFAVIDYNTDPVIPYAGSAIFVHADTGEPTTGCVSIPLADLDQVLRWIDPHDDPTIVMAPASEIADF